MKDKIFKMGLIFLIIAIVIIVSGHLYQHNTFSLHNFFIDFYANLGSELLSISITIIVVDRIIRAISKEESETELRNQLLQELHSPVNNVASAAVHRLRAIGKLVGKDAWTIGANLRGKANLRGARLLDANFQGAKLFQADFTESDLRNVNFVGADLTEAIFENAIITNVRFNTSTILPDGNHWNNDTDMGKFGGITKPKSSWVEKIDTSDIEIDHNCLMALPITAKNLKFYLKAIFKEEEELVKDDTQYERHWQALEKYGYLTINEVHDLLERTEEIRH